MSELSISSDQNKKYPCPLCNKLYLDKDFKYDDLLCLYICTQCIQEMEDENNPNKIQCEECGIYCNIDDIEDVSDVLSIPSDYICCCCYEQWEELWDKQETQASMMPGRI